MAKTKSSVTMAYQKAIKEANTIAEIATRVRLQRDHLGESGAELSGSWKGENAKAYIDKMKLKWQELDRGAVLLDQIARVIREVAKNTYDADMKAVELANGRKYGS